MQINNLKQIIFRKYKYVLLFPMSTIFLGVQCAIHCAAECCIFKWVLNLNIIKQLKKCMNYRVYKYWLLF